MTSWVGMGMLRQEMAKIIKDSLQCFFGFASRLMHLQSLERLQCNGWLECGYVGLSVLFAQYDVARQRERDIGILLQCFICEFRIARTEDLVRRMIDPKLLFQFCLNIDLGNDAELLFLQSIPHLLLRFNKREWERQPEAVIGRRNHR